MSLLELRDKVQRWLLEYGIQGLTVSKSGDYSFRVGSTRVFVGFDECGSGEDAFSIVRIVAPFLQKTTATPELFQWMAESSDDYFFGHPILIGPDDEGRHIVALKHVLLGDYIDQEELLHATIGLAFAADKIDDELATRFGGEVFYGEGE